jgi:hypothetical protein
MKRTKFKKNSEALEYLRENGKYNTKGELVLNEGIKTLNYPNSEDPNKVSLRIDTMVLN